MSCSDEPPIVVDYYGNDICPKCCDSILQGEPHVCAAPSSSWLIELVFPFPPSVNTYWRSPTSGPLSGRHLISVKGRQFRVEAIARVLEQLRRLPKPIKCDVNVSLRLYPPDRRARDLDNYLKAALDAITHARIWNDDKQVKRLNVEWGPVVRSGKAEISISEFQPGGD